jgi:hypothetical protein
MASARLWGGGIRGLGFARYKQLISLTQGVSRMNRTAEAAPSKTDFVAASDEEVADYRSRI